MVSTPDPFVPAFGAAGPHAQTVLGFALRPRRGPPGLRTSIPTPDGDHVEVVRTRGAPGAPTVVILHGLEGSPDSGYVLELVRGARARGLGTAAIALRSCGRRAHRGVRTYHAGDTADLGLICAQLAREPGAGPLVGVGVSLGGSILLGHLAEAGAASPLAAAVAISVPFDLGASSRALDAGRGMVALYRARFLRSLHVKAAARALRDPGSAWSRAPGPAAGLVRFDDLVTAPAHGFAGVDDYYGRCSAGPRLGAIRRPTLLVSSADDPLVPAATFPHAQIGANPALTGLFTARGGHAGFVGGTLARPRFFAEETALAFLVRAAGEQAFSPSTG